MKTPFGKQNIIASILGIMLLIYGVQGIGYAQEANPTITASTPQPLTETNLHQNVVTLTLSGGTYEIWIQRGIVSISGIDGVTFHWLADIDRVSDTEVTVELTFNGDFDSDATLTIEVGAGAIVDYNGPALTAQLPVTAVEESLNASTETPLTETNLHESVVTLTLSGRQFADEWFIERALTISGIEGAAISQPFFDVDRVSDTEATVELTFAGNIDTDMPLTFTIGAAAIANYNGTALTAQLPVTAIEESLTAATESPLTEANLHGSVVTLTLSGRGFNGRGIRDALTLSGIEGVTVSESYNSVKFISGTEITVKLAFNGNISTDATLTLTVGADAIGRYNKDFTLTLPVTAVEESLNASTETPLTEANLHGSVVTLTLSGRTFARRSDIQDALTFSGIEDVTVAEGSWDSGVERVSDTEVTVELTFAGNIDTETTLTFTIGAAAIANYNGTELTAQLPVTAVEESLNASTESPLTEANLDGSVVTLTLSGRQFVHRYDIRDALTFSGIEGVTVAERSWEGGDVEYVSDTEVKVTLTFNGNISTDATLTLTVGKDAIVGYNNDFTLTFPVTAVEESLNASPEAPLTEANLDGSVVTLTLSGRTFARRSDIREALTLSGIDGVTVSWYYDGVERVSDTEAKVTLAFNGDFDSDATLTLTVGKDAIGSNKDFTFNFPVTAIEQSDATVSVSPSPIALPGIGEKLTLNLDIANGKNIAGYKATVSFDPSTLRYVESANADYLPADAFFVDPIPYYTYDKRRFLIAGNTLAEARNGDGTLATLTFEVVDYKPSTVTLFDVYLVDADGKRWEVTTKSGEVIEPPELKDRIFGDLNLDGVVNIQDLVIVSKCFGCRGELIEDVNGDGLVDIVDLALVTGAFEADAAAPASYPAALEMFTAAEVQQWLSQKRHLNLTDPRARKGILFLEQLLVALTPKKTALLANYPNPFNPETWIPYHLAKDADVTLTIYAINGTLVRTLALGHQPAGIYQNRSRAAYWDGKNQFGEPVASGVYFYTLTAGDFTATRKMLIRK